VLPIDFIVSAFHFFSSPVVRIDPLPWCSALLDVDTYNWNSQHAQGFSLEKNTQFSRQAMCTDVQHISTYIHRGLSDKEEGEEYSSCCASVATSSIMRRAPSVSFNVDSHAEISPSSTHSLPAS